MNNRAFYDMKVMTGYIEDSEVEFLIKFGQKKHLEEIINGNIRFCPSQKYIEQEKLLHDKGQGDLLEGKMRLMVDSARMYDQQTNELMFEINKPSELIVTIQNVNSMPICCFFAGTKQDYKRVNKDNYKIKFNSEIEQTIKHDFHEPDSALIIFNPSDFIANMKINLNAAASSIRYYDYSIQTLQQYRFLCSGSEEGSVGSMVYENRYRHLLCKDISFKNQKEYRFIVLNELINEPKLYPFAFDYDYLIVPATDLFSGLMVERH